MTERLQRVFLGVVLLFMALALLWKGGKGLEVTWLLVGLSWLSVVLARRREWTLPLWLWAVGILFILWTALSYVQSKTANYGLDEVLRDAALLFLFFWAAREATEKREGALSFQEQLLRALAYITIAASVIGFAVYILQPVNRFVGTFFDFRFHTDYWPNAWAEFLLIGWPAVYFWSFRFAADWQQSTSYWHGSFFRALLLGLPLTGLFLSYSRGALIAFAGQLVLFFLLRALLGWRPRFERSTYRDSGVLLLIIFFFFWGSNLLRGRLYDVESVADKVTFTADEGASSVSERGQFWSQALTLGKEQPLLGFGPGSFRFMQPHLQDTVLATSDHPHNVFLKLLSERGLPAMLLWLILVGTVLGHALFTHRFPGSEDEARRRTWNVLFITGVAGVMAHNLIDYNLQFVGIALPLWLTLGVLAAPLRGHVVPRVQTPITLVMASVVLLVAFVEGLFLITSSLGRHAEVRGDDAEALLWYDRSRLEHFTRDLHLSRTHLLLETKQFPEAVAAADMYLAQNEQDGRGWKLSADACLANRDMVCALAALDKAYAYSRFNDLSVVLAQLTLHDQVGLRADIVARRTEYEALLRDFGKAIEDNRHYVALSPNAEMAIALSQKLAELFPEEEPTYILVGASIERAMEKERAALNARPPGFLW